LKFNIIKLESNPKYVIVSQTDYNR